MIPRITFEQLCPEWSEKFKKTQKTPQCEEQMDCYPTCALGEAYGIRQLVHAKTDNKSLELIPTDKKYYSTNSKNFCLTCDKMAEQFDYAYDLNKKSVIETLKKNLVDHFVEKHQDVLKERGFTI